MFDLTIMDYIYVGVILASTIWATIRGGIYETVATMSWVAAAITARFVSPMLDKLLQGWFGLSDSTVGTLIASYFIVFFVILLVVGFINQKLRDKIQESVINVTDHTLGVIFGIVRGVFVMGMVYWGMLYFYSDAQMPTWLSNARTRPLMQLAAQKVDQWFVPGPPNRILMRDIAGSREAVALYNNLINPAVQDSDKKADTPQEKPKTALSAAKAPEKKSDAATETGYKSSERTALENQLLQIDSDARASQQRAAARAARESETE